ncbi:hypothetical protein [Nostoc sp.]|uniref:hypothetical protein n=1 Tax=Nostoc sp. TaxID=1180 RepID=UPI002FFBFF0D
MHLKTCSPNSLRCYKSVNGIVHQLHVLGFAEVSEWTPLLPSPVSDEVIIILIRYINVSV